MELREVGIDDGRWVAFASSHPRATAFHHPAWAAVLGETYGFRPFALLLEGEAGEVVAGLPVVEARRLRTTRWLSLPFTDLCPPLAADDALPGLATALETGARAAGVVLEAHAELPPPFHTVPRGIVHTLALRRNADELRPTFSRSQVRRNIERAEREGVSVRRGASRGDLLDTFYALHLQTRRRQGVPIQPRRFFERLWARVVEPGLGFVLVAEVEGRPAAAAVFLAWGSTVTYKFGASDPALWSRRPNHLLFWQAIRGACEEGYAVLDFGRTDAENAGLRAFKSGWGTVEAPLVYSATSADALAGTGRAQAMLAPLIRHAPAWVCRTVGETVYRYAA